MGLREELERLIGAERQKLEARDRLHSEFHDVQRARFAPLHAVLNELAQAVEPAYVHLRLHDSSAVIELGYERGGHFRTQLRCAIEPNYATQFPADRGESLFREAPGYRIEETHYFEYPEYDTSEHTAVFDDASAAAEHLAQKIAEHVAHQRHLAAVAQQRKG